MKQLKVILKNKFLTINFYPFNLQKEVLKQEAVPRKAIMSLRSKYSEAMNWKRMHLTKEV